MGGEAKRLTVPIESRVIELALPPGVAKECAEVAELCPVPLAKIRAMVRTAAEEAANAAVRGRVAQLVRAEVNRSLGGEQAEIPHALQRDLAVSAAGGGLTADGGPG